MSKDFSERPSSLWGINQTASSFTGFEDDPWTCWKFDQAIYQFGNWVEAKSSELNEKTHKPKYPLSFLLAEIKRNPTIQEVQASFSDVRSVSVS